MQNKYVTDTSKLWGQIVFVVIGLSLILSLMRDVSSMQKGYVRFEDAQKRLESLQRENAELKQNQQLISTSEYQERFFRDKLHMYKPGESIIVLPEFENEIDTVEKIEAKENWRKWLDLIK